MDADLQHDTNAVSIFYDLIKTNKFDLIIGSRFLDNSFVPSLPAIEAVVTNNDKIKTLIILLII